MRETKLRRVRRGAVIAKHAYVLYESKDVACVIVALRSKYVDVGHWSANYGYHHYFDLLVTRDTMYTDKKRDKLTTCVVLPEFKDWYVFLSDKCARYEFRVVYVREKEG